MTTDFSADLVRDFITQYKVSHDVAVQAVDLFLTVAASLPQERVSSEFTARVMDMARQGVPWAVELTQSLLLPYRVTYEIAVRHGDDPARALMTRHCISLDDATRIVEALSGGK